MKKSYFSRFQTKQRRRREGKTDYARRRKLLTQDKNKHGNYKNRLVVRITNSQVIVQVVRATLKGDCILASAYSSELVAHGLKVGLTNYSACYATGLLCGLRILNKFNMDENEKELMCVLDIGLRRATKGARVFAALKGALDSGVHIPHSDSKFFSEEDNENALRDRLFGKSLAEYMTILKQESPEKYKKQFSQFIANQIDETKIEKMYEGVFESVRNNFNKPEKKEKKDYSGFKQFRKEKLSLQERRQRVEAKLAN